MESKLNYEQMCIFVAENHARNDHNNPYSFGQVCCEIDAGHHFCFSTSLNSGFEKFGVGITLYFKLLKYLIFFFLIFIILSLPVLYLNIEG